MADKSAYRTTQLAGMADKFANRTTQFTGMADKSAEYTVQNYVVQIMFFIVRNLVCLINVSVSFDLL